MAFQENINASIYMFSFFRIYQMFLKVRGTVQGSFRATLGVASVFVHVVLRPGWGALRCPPPQHHHHHRGIFFFGVNLDYLDFLRWHLRPANCMNKVNTAVSKVLKSNWYRTDTPQIRMESSTYAVDTSRVHFIRHTYVTRT